MVLVSNILGNTVGKPLQRFQNRNRNSSLNMRNIIENYKKEGERKLEFSRSYKLNNNNEKNEKPNFGLPKLGHILTTMNGGPNFVILKCNTSKPNIKKLNVKVWEIWFFVYLFIPLGKTKN